MQFQTNVERCLTSRYNYVVKTKADLKSVLSQFRSLVAKKETFIFNDGTSKELVCLDGTVPASYKGKTYNFPVKIWILDTHPYHAPLCYVCPTVNMQIKVSQYVDESGRVYLPYLHSWNPNQSDLKGLVQVMVMIFGKQPPVYSAPPQSAQTTPYPPRDSMPTPGMGMGGPSTGGGGGAATQATPTPYPPYPSYNNNTLSISEEHIKASLLSAVESRIVERAMEFEQKFIAEEEVLKKTCDDLTSGRIKLDSYMAQMKYDLQELENNLGVLREKNEQLKQSIETMSDKDKQIDIDGAVTTTAPLYKQLLNAYAEESAVEDTIYYLGEGLRKGVIDLDVFLKHVRELSRKQFMLRALMQKCRQKAALPPL